MAARKRDWSAALEASGETSPAIPCGTTADGAPSWPTDVIACLLAMRPLLESGGIEWFTPWWWERITAFYASGKRQFTARVGRRGRKSYSWCIVGVAEILTGRHAIPPGDTGVVAVVSADLPQANDRLNTFTAVLEAVGLREKVDYTRTARGIEFKTRPYRVQTLAASVSAVSSYTCIMAIGDEVAKWRDGEEGVSLGDRVLASWRSTMRTQPLAKMILLSSPVGNDDPHAKAFDLGETARQMTAHAETWIANPSLTVEWCRSDCETEQEFLQECAAIPQIGGSNPVLLAQLARATRGVLVLGRHEPLTYVAAMRPVQEDSDTWSLVVVTRRTCPDRRVRSSVVYARQWIAAPEPDPVFAAIRLILRGYGLGHVLVNDDAPDYVAALARRHGLGLTPCPITDRAHASLRLRLADDGLELPDDPDLRADLVQRGDYADVVALAVERAMAGPREDVHRPDPWSSDWWDRQERDSADRRRRLQAAEDRHDAGWVQRLAKAAGYR